MRIKVSEDWKELLGTDTPQETAAGMLYTGDAVISLDEMDAGDREKIFSVAYEHWTPWKCEGLVYLDTETGELIGHRRLSGHTDFLSEKPLLYLLKVNILDTISPEEFFTPEEIAEFGRCIRTEDYVRMLEQDEPEFKKRLIRVLEYRAEE